jgi:hypothetical protein
MDFQQWDECVTIGGVLWCVCVLCVCGTILLYYGTILAYP